MIRIYLNVCKQMTDVKFLLLHSNSRNNLTVHKQMRNDLYWVGMLEILTVKENDLRFV